MKPAPFEYHAARSVDEALELLSRYGDEAKVLAGGQSLAPLLNMRLARPAVLVDINRVPGLDAIRAEDGTIGTGALVRQRKAEQSAAVRDGLPLVAEALPWIGHPTIRNRGTIGGSICHADPAAELPAMAVALDAKMVIASGRGTRSVPAANFFTGFLSTALGADELLVEVRWPRQKSGAGSAWVELALRHGDYALVGVAAAVALDGSGRCRTAELTCAGVADRPIRLAQATEALIGQPLTDGRLAQAGEEAAASIEPSSDLLASAAYKRRLVKVLVVRALKAAHSRARERA